MKLAVALVAGALLGLAGARPCAACSCVPRDTREIFRAAEAALVGFVVDRREKGPRGAIRSSADIVVYTIRVDERLKGDLGESVEVETAEASATCGLEMRVGTRVGLALRRHDNRWVTGLCDHVTPEQVRAAARPLPRPDGRGPATLVVGGSFGEARTIALDARGRTLAYAYGWSDTIAVSVCPGRQRVAELVRVAGARTPVVAVRTLPRLRLVRSRPIPNRLLEGRWIREFACRDAFGRDVLIFARHDGDSARAAILVRARVGGFDVVGRGSAEAAVFVGRRAYLVEPPVEHRIVAFDLRTKKRRALAPVPAGIHTLVPSPDGRHLAAYADESSTLVLVRAADGRVRTTRLPRGFFGELVWTSASRLAFLSRSREWSSRVYDTTLRVRGRPASWNAGYATVRADRIYGIAPDGHVVTRDLSGREIRTLRLLPTWSVYAVD